MDKVIFVMGASYCGSTLLSMLMSRIPGVASPGEVHWILDDPAVGCSVHGDQCELVRGIDRSGLNDGNLYSRVSACLDTTHLVTTDKWSGHATRFMPHVPVARRMAVFLFKQPEAAVCSFQRHLARGTLVEAVELYCATHEHLLQFASGGFFGQCEIVPYESLAADPAEVMNSLCARFGLESPRIPADLSPPLYASGWHNIGGNPPTHLGERYKDRAVVPDDRWSTELSVESQRIITASPRATAVWTALRRATTVGKR